MERERREITEQQGLTFMYWVKINSVRKLPLRTEKGSYTVLQADSVVEKRGSK